jgi:UDP-N-acetylmuramate--alanine ligase
MSERDRGGGAGERPWRGRRIHLVGVGGAGMSAYARAAASLGAQVSGSDAVAGPGTEALAADGVLSAHIGHHAQNVPVGADVELFYSSAVPDDNPEREAARERGIGESPRAVLLGELSALRRTIAVAGTHGKTTTASMLVHALRGAGIEPSWLIGGTAGGALPNARWGDGEWLVVEADESDRSMLSLQVEIAVLTNVELDHHATFASLRELREAFAAFLALARTGVVIWQRPELFALLPATAPAVAAFETQQLELGVHGVRMSWRGHDVSLRVPGAHNALDALAALEAARMAGADEARLAASLASFEGAGRRFQLLGSVAGASIYDDYAHHPSEVAATLGAARTLEPKRLVAVFQPHLYSRTAALAADFGRALALADVIAVLDVYAARERREDHPGVSGLRVAEAAADAAAGRAVYWLPTFADAEPVLRGLLADGDLCVAMGAGDIDTLSHSLMAAA